MLPTTPYLNDTLNKEVIFITGKGGVGKSTLARAIALRATAEGKRARIISLSEIVGIASDPFEYEFTILSPMECLREYMKRKLPLESLVDAAFKHELFSRFVRVTPGLADTVMAGKMWDLWKKREQDLLIIDLPSSGHALSFFKTPIGVAQVFRIGFVHHELEKIWELWTSPSTRIDIVTLPEELPVQECKELHQGLAQITPSLPIGFIIVNQTLPAFNDTGENDFYHDHYRHRRLQEQELIENLKSLDRPILQLNRRVPLHDESILG